MKMFNRRTMFAAMAAVGLPALVADEAVARAFEDKDYLRERDARRERDDKEEAALRVKQAHDNEILDRPVRQYHEVMGAGYDLDKPVYFKATKAELKVLLYHNRIDYIPDAAGKRMIPVCMGMHVEVI